MLLFNCIRPRTQECFLAAIMQKEREEGSRRRGKGCRGPPTHPSSLSLTRHHLPAVWDLAIPGGGAVDKALHSVCAVILQDKHLGICRWAGGRVGEWEGGGEAGWLAG